MNDPKTKKHAGGRPTAMTPAVLAKLELAFSIGASDSEACAQAEINKATYYRKREKDAQFCDRVDTLKETLPMKAKAQLAALIEAGDKQTVLWYLERKRKNEFSLKQEVDVTTAGKSIKKEMSDNELYERLRGLGVEC